MARTTSRGEAACVASEVICTSQCKGENKIIQYSGVDLGYCSVRGTCTPPLHPSPGSAPGVFILLRFNVCEFRKRFIDVGYSSSSRVVI